ncbi:putative reverse transcriptase zinc-binding domain-containing protein [Helianthus annuus]|nr:putative reverse transcriptase zinc-binding domain-containing protein [Helianthus annuus]
MDFRIFWIRFRIRIFLNTPRGWIKTPNSNVEWTELGNLMGLLQGPEYMAGEDKWTWANDFGVHFATKSIRYELELKESVFTDRCSFRWNTWVPLKVNYLAWRAELGRLAAKVSLRNRGVTISDVKCSRCTLRDETSDHISAECLWAKSVWWNVYRWVMIPILNDGLSVTQILNHFQSQIGSKRRKRVV